jgi:hypothetical protein
MRKYFLARTKYVKLSIFADREKFLHYFEYTAYRLFLFFLIIPHSISVPLPEKLLDAPFPGPPPV